MKNIFFYFGIFIRILLAPIAVPTILFIGAICAPEFIWDALCSWFSGKSS